MKPPKFRHRVFAYHFDILISTILFEGVHVWWLENRPDLITFINVFALFIGVIFFYFILPTKVFGKTLGKKLYGLQVVSAKDLKSELTWSQLFRRELVFKSIGTLFLGYGFWRARHDEQARALHDVRGQTLVVASEPIHKNRFVAWFIRSVIAFAIFVTGMFLLLWAFYATSLPLRALEVQLRGHQIFANDMRGSFAKGLYFESLRKEGELGSLQFQGLEIKINAAESFKQGHLVLDFVKADQANLQAHNFFEANDLARSFAEAMTEENPGLQMQNFSIQAFTFNSPEVNLTGKDFKISEGMMSVHSLVGEVNPLLLPVLKRPVHFEVAGSLDLVSTETPRTKYNGRLPKEDVDFSVDQERFQVDAVGFPIADVFIGASTGNDNSFGNVLKEKLNIQLQGNATNWDEFFLNVQHSRGLKICSRGVLVPKKSVTISEEIFRPGRTLEQLFELSSIHADDTPCSF